MDRTERFQRMVALLKARRVVSRGEFLEALEVSLATFKRDLEYLRERLGAPIVYDREAGGYRLDEAEGCWELPGAWFTASEAHALLTVEVLLEGLEPGLLGPRIAALRERVRAMLGADEREAEAVRRRVRVLGVQARGPDPEHFRAVADALLARRRLWIRHYSRVRDEETEREVSPQRLVHYRNTWYLDAWCHLRGDLRSFALEAIRAVRVLEEAAEEVAEERLDAHFAEGYGIFAGPAKAVAHLRFTPERARWVAAERWHPRQRGWFDEAGCYHLELPYSDERELVMDVLRHGAEVEVLAPRALRARVAAELEAAAARYREP
ncbi:helix-turn-helix transcriptional regulator [Inmirania thermothiophila]|uniref:Putative DNA-binding transcriptional regulator YafY n=1 Tax=Inmirania thermothiophila TaxID=1750597 RepID=A0A3N1Y5X2_9GAMM|nr:WYL domain-containing protein [Inmirania thermothiophila]ROR32697.1 putative DNA-binding transcriptional regulator YafY [Inmirania thermothiophila]